MTRGVISPIGPALGRPPRRREARPFRQGHRRRPFLRSEPPQGFLRSRDRRAAHRPACRRLLRTGPCDLIRVRDYRSPSPCISPTQQCRTKRCWPSCRMAGRWFRSAIAWASHARASTLGSPGTSRAAWPRSPIVRDVRAAVRTRCTRRSKARRARDDQHPHVPHVVASATGGICAGAEAGARADPGRCFPRYRAGSTSEARSSVHSRIAVWMSQARPA
jgi:hypothetical protein